MRKLYTETLRRLAPAGLLLTLLFGTISLILGLNYNPSFVNIQELNYLLYAFPYVAGAALAMVGFSFLNKRAASDLYLGLPYKRSTLFWGIMLGILTWGAIALSVSLLMTALSLTFRSCIFLWAHIGVLFVYWFIAFMLVVGALTLGQCLSGQWFFGLSWGLVLLFMVRYILFIYVLYMDSNLDMVWGFRGLLNPGINFVTGILAYLLDVFTGYGMESPFFLLSGYIYSILIAGVYMGLGTLAFCKRNGELSGSHASSLKMQHLLSMLTGFVPTLLGLFLTTEYVGGSGTFVTVLVVIGVLTFLCYELVASRSVGKTLKSLGWYAVSFAVAMLCVLGMKWGATLYMDSIPTSGDEIASVSFVDSYGLGGTDSQQALMGKVKLTDAEILDLVAEGIRPYKEDSVDAHTIMSYNCNARVIVRLKSGRTLHIRTMVNDQLQGLLSEQETYQSILSPDAMPVGKDVVGVRLWNNRLDVKTNAEYIALYNDLVAEMQKNPEVGEDCDLISMLVYTKVGLQIYEDTVRVYRSQAPNTAKKLVEMSLHQVENLTEIWQHMEISDLTVRDISPNEGGSIGLYSTWATEEITGEDLLALLRQMSFAEGTEEHMLRVNVYGYYDGEYNGYGRYFSMTLPLYLAPTEEQYAAYQKLYALAKGDEEKAEELGYMEYSSEGVLYY